MQVVTTPHPTTTYTQIYIIVKFENLCKGNICPMILTIKQEPKRLLLLTISLAARTHLVKMNTYSKLLYLLQSLPVLMPQAFIRKCDIHFEI